MIDDKLLYFLFAAENSSFSKTAAHFFISSTAVSKAIANLEARIGVQLFLRHKNSIELTAQGRAFYENAKFIASDYQNAIEAAKKAGGIQKKPIKIGFSSIYEARLITPVINKFLKKYPKIKVTFTHRSVEQLLQAIDEGSIDIGLTFEKSKVSPSITAVSLYESDYLIGLSKENQLANKQILTSKDLLSETCGYYSQYNSALARQLLLDSASQNGFQINQLKQYETYETLLISVATNQCFAFFPKLFAIPNWFPDITFVPAEKTFSSYQLVALQKKTASRDSESSLLIDFLKREILNSIGINLCGRGH